MKQIMKYMFVAVTALSLVACREDFDKVDGVSFNATTDAVVYKVGQPVIFNLAGNPDIITFYSGEVGNAYAYKDTERIIENPGMAFSFAANTTNGNLIPNPLRVPISYSYDFSGEYTEDAVRAATWHDISDRFTWPQTTKDGNVFSGRVDLGDVFSEIGRPVYFKYHFLALAAMQQRSQWAIYSPTFYGTAQNVLQPLYELHTSGWTIVWNEASYANDKTNRDKCAVTSTRIYLTSVFTLPSDRECWAVSGPIVRPAEINNGTDMGSPIKSAGQSTLRNFRYIYNEPGEYTVSFVAANANVYDRKEQVVEMKITVVGDEGTITPPEQDEWN